MSYTEYPHTNYYDTDLRELIEMYNNLTKWYRGIVENLARLDASLSKYRREVKQEIPDAVAVAMLKYEAELESECLRVQQMIESLARSVETKVKTLETVDASILKRLDEYNSRFIEWRELFESRLTSTELKCSVQTAEMRKDLSTAVAEMYEVVRAIPQSSSPVYDPIMQKLEPFDVALSNMYNYGINRFGFTAIEFTNATEITCQYFNDSAISALDFFTIGKPVLLKLIENHKMFSPITGEYVTVEAAISDVVGYIKTLHNIGPSAAGYDSLQIDAENYEAQQLTASNYDFLPM